MKNLIGALALTFSALASAQTVAVGQNNGGGLIVLTGQACTNPDVSQLSRDNSRHVYAFTSDGTTIAGCYFVKDGAEVHVLWHIGARNMSVYPIRNFAVR